MSASDHKFEESTSSGICRICGETHKATERLKITVCDENGTLRDTCEIDLLGVLERLRRDHKKQCANPRAIMDAAETAIEMVCDEITSACKALVAERE